MDWYYFIKMWTVKLYLPVALLSVVTRLVWAEFEQLPYPPELLDCLVNKQNKSNSDTPGELISTYCITKYLCVMAQPSGENKTDQKLQQLIQKLINQGREEAHRIKRQAEPIRVRKEYRMLTNNERKKFHKAVQMLKKDGEYDELAKIHRRAEVLKSGHGGPNFLGWHRVYLYLFEQALRSKVEGVSLPYWDCTLDFELNDPTQSVIFSSTFAGNGNGQVISGKFKKWGIVRNIGQSGRLISKQIMNRIVRRTRGYEIVEPDALDKHNLEFQHNGIHSWVGGDLKFLNTATRDPIFFMLHSFIDYIWWKFQQRQLSNGIDPANDYPLNVGNDRHNPGRKMVGFGTDMYRNIDGYSNHWTRDIYTYELSPKCATNCEDSAWLSCIEKRCVSKTRNELNRQLSTPIGRDILRAKSLHATKPGAVDTFNVASSAVISHLFKADKSNSNDICEEKSPTQNTFEIDGKSSSDQWVYLPVKLTTKRAWDIMFNSYPIRNGQVVLDADIYTATDSRVMESFLTQQSAPRYEHCTRSGTGALKIDLRVDGLNYDGHSFEHAITDERLPFSSGYAYVPIKNPYPNGTEIMITAHDECGRLCRPMCRFKGNADYTPCTGLLRLGPNDNDMYASSIPEVIQKVWNLKQSPVCPIPSDEFIYLNFLCDADAKPPWDFLRNKTKLT